MLLKQCANVSLTRPEHNGWRFINDILKLIFRKRRCTSTLNDACPWRPDWQYGCISRSKLIGTEQATSHCICQWRPWPLTHQNPDSKVHGANMGPTWILLAPCWPHEPCYQGIYSSLGLDKCDSETRSKSRKRTTSISHTSCWNEKCMSAKLQNLDIAGHHIQQRSICITETPKPHKTSYPPSCPSWPKYGSLF